ncbi:hypothetical protein DT075_07415 [Bacillus licheniformis]|nr:hypothetical protein DT075_07415 [Bacillus licheniformis]
MKESARSEIVKERDQAVTALREQVASLSVMIASKVIEKELDEQAQEKLIQDYLKEVGESRLLNIMKEREDYITGEISSAEKKNEEAKKLIEEQQALLKEAREESQSLIENAKKLGEQQKDEIIKAGTLLKKEGEHFSMASER